MGRIEIVEFAAKHIDEILDIQSECKLSVWSKNGYLGELEREDSIFKIAQTANEKIIGFALTRLVISSNSPSFKSQNHLEIPFDSSEILNIAVRNSFQHKGIGQMIFDEILRELRSRNISEIWLEVRKSNASAIKFYRQNNFEMQFERKNYYTNPTETACVLRRLINVRADDNSES